MVEVFKTNVKCPLAAKLIIADLLAFFTSLEVNFDLEDKDCILRLSTEHTVLNLEEQVLEIVKHNGYTAEMLSDEPTSDLLISTESDMSINAFLTMF